MMLVVVVDCWWCAGGAADVVWETDKLQERLAGAAGCSLVVIGAWWCFTGVCFNLAGAYATAASC